MAKMKAKTKVRRTPTAQVGRPPKATRVLEPPTEDGRRKVLTDAQRAACAPGTFTLERQKAFLRLFATGLPVKYAAEEVGVSHVTVFNHCRKGGKFKELFDEARELNLDSLEDRLHELAIAGNPVAIFGVLKAFRPDRWRENMRVDGAIVHQHQYTLAIARVMRGVTVDASQQAE